MCNAQDAELLILLDKVNTALVRIQRELEPITWRQNRQRHIMPDVPSGLPDCTECEGVGFVQFINPETDLWTSKKCVCTNG